MPSSPEWECRPSGRQSSGIQHLLLLFMRSPHSAFLQLCLARQIEQIPGLSIFSSTQVKCHHISAWFSPPPPQTNRWEQPKLGARGRGRCCPRPADDRRAQGGLLTPRPRSLVLSIRPTPGLLRRHPLAAARGPGQSSGAGPSSARRRPRLGVPVHPGEADAGDAAGAAQVTREAWRAHSDAALEL